ncbi:MAG: hypothetical protein JRG89_23420, partial [Deltaproteobacteria bacterium]|nr:hypothetical protein [Deltaproteobacteria bacterium]
MAGRITLSDALYRLPFLDFESFAGCHNSFAASALHNTIRQHNLDSLSASTIFGRLVGYQPEAAGSPNPLAAS